MRDRLSRRSVSDIRNLVVSEPATVGPKESIAVLLEKLISDPRTRHVYVVDDNGVLIGSVRLNAVIAYLFPHEVLWETMSLRTYDEQLSNQMVEDIMNVTFQYVADDTTVSEMAQIMIREQVNELPVVDKDNRVIGEVNLLEAITYYLNSIHDSQRT